MKFLKGLGLAILGFLLFLSLSVFGLAFMLKSTLLNPDFVVKEVDRLDLPALTGEFIQGQVGGVSAAEAQLLEDAFRKVVADLEPQLKEQAGGVIYAGYDYFLGKSDDLRIYISLVSLKAGMKDSLTEAFSDYLSTGVAALPADLLRPYLEDNYRDIIAQIPPKYLPAEVAGMSDAQLKMYLEQNYEQLIQEIPPPQLETFTSQLETQIEPYIDEYYDAFAAEIPDSYTVDASSVPADVMQALAQARQYIGYFQTGYWLLIVFMVVLAGLIILIRRSVRDATRSLGIDLLLCGVLDLAFVLLSRYYSPQLMPLMADLPASLQTWVMNLANDFLTPALIFAIGLLVAGAVLLAVSFIIKPRVTAGEA